MTFAVKLDKRVTIQSPSMGQDEYGQPLAGWADVGTVWASIRDVSGRQYVAAQATQNSVQTIITIRYQKEIAPGMRVSHGSDLYDIEAVLNRDDHRLELMAKRGASNG
jgi:SPP1 family predicted phage head-tail adaptor